MQLSTCTPLRTTCGHRRRRPTTERDVPCEFHRAPPSPGSRSSCLSPSRAVLCPSWACQSIDHVTPEETSGSGQTGGVRATRSSPQPSPSTQVLTYELVAGGGSSPVTAPPSGSSSGTGSAAVCGGVLSELALWKPAARHGVRRHGAHVCAAAWCIG